MAIYQSDFEAPLLELLGYMSLLMYEMFSLTIFIFT